MANRFREVTNPRIYKRLMRERDTGCSYCAPHRNENAPKYVWKRKKKEYQLTPRQKNWRHRSW